MTFRQLRKKIFEIAGVKNHFELNLTGQAYIDFWNKINKAEFNLGYVSGEYEKPGSPALCEMDLLTDEEFGSWVKEFKCINFENIQKKATAPGV